MLARHLFLVPRNDFSFPMFSAHQKHITYTSGASFLTGNTLRRTGVEGNTMVKKGGSLSALRQIGAQFAQKVQNIRTFEQILVEQGTYTVSPFGSTCIHKWWFSVIFAPCY